MSSRRQSLSFSIDSDEIVAAPSVPEVFVHLLTLSRRADPYEPSKGYTLHFNIFFTWNGAGVGGMGSARLGEGEGGTWWQDKLYTSPTKEPVHPALRNRAPCCIRA